MSLWLNIAFLDYLGALRLKTGHAQQTLLLAATGSAGII